MSKDVLSRLSVTQRIRYERFIWTLNESEKGLPFLSTLAVTSMELGQAIQKDIQQKQVDFKIADSPVPVKTLEWRPYFDDPKHKYFIIPLYTLPDKLAETLAEHLIFFRDMIVKHALHINVILSKKQFDSLHRIAYDYIQASNFSEIFYDQRVEVDRDLAKFEGKPEPVVKYEHLLKEYEELKNEGKQKSRLFLEVLFNLANSAQLISKLEGALEYYFLAYKIAKKRKDKNYLSAILGNIGLIYSDKGDLDESLKYLKQALELHRQIGYVQGEASDLGNIGLIYRSKGDLDESLKYHKQALELHRQIGYVQGEANQLGNIGLIYSDKGDLDESLKYHKQALELHRQIGYVQGEANQLGNIGLIYSDKGDLDESLKYLKQAQELLRQLGNLATIEKVEGWIVDIEKRRKQ